jgi:hypothetical protein
MHCAGPFLLGSFSGPVRVVTAHAKDILPSRPDYCSRRARGIAGEPGIAGPIDLAHSAAGMPSARKDRRHATRQCGRRNVAALRPCSRRPTKAAAPTADAARCILCRVWVPKMVTRHAKLGWQNGNSSEALREIAVWL